MYQLLIVLDRSFYSDSNDIKFINISSIVPEIWTIYGLSMWLKWPKCKISLTCVLTYMVKTLIWENFTTLFLNSHDSYRNNFGIIDKVCSTLSANGHHDQEQLLCLFSFGSFYFGVQSFVLHICLQSDQTLILVVAIEL